MEIVWWQSFRLNVKNINAHLNTYQWQLYTIPEGCEVFLVVSGKKM